MEDFIQISLFREYFFCQRIPYFYFRDKDIQPYKICLKQGIEYQINKIKNLKKRMIKNLSFPDSITHYEKKVVSYKYKIYGIVDLFIETKEFIYPVEIKLLAKKIRKGHIMQTFAYGICLEEMFNKKFNEGFILYGKKAKIYKIERNKELEKEFLQLLEKMKELKDRILIPTSDASIFKCVQCEYLNLCNDRNI
jgi:CRISPR-associated exonuclease Cas4